MTPWREAALKRGYRSSASIPFAMSGDVLFSLSLYAAEPNAFTTEETKLLVNLADDVSYALEFILREERLEYLAYYDPLTKLANRHLFCERLDGLIKATGDAKQPFAVIQFDIDGFRFINDAVGRRGGDEVLEIVAERLLDNAADPADIARTDSNRFAMVLKDAGNIESVTGVIQGKISKALQPVIVVNGHPLHLLFNFGIAQYPVDGNSAEVLLPASETALKQAKQNSELLTFYTKEMGAALAEHFVVESRLRAAIENREFVLYYQPKVDAHSGLVVGAEALIRWMHPELGLLLPARFIASLEESGLILQLGLWTLEQVHADYQRWQRAGLSTVPIAVNVSAVQLRQNDFVSTFQRLADPHTGKIAGLEIEITESTLLGDIEKHAEKLGTLRDLGVKISIDDFGTGYSSLSYLMQLPIDSLKIDASFVKRMSENVEAVTIISSIMQLAQSMKLKVVAEGVETAEQFKILRAMRCDQIQGWLFGKAMPAEDFARLLRDHTQTPLPLPLPLLSPGPGR